MSDNNGNNTPTRTQQAPTNVAKPAQPTTPQAALWATTDAPYSWNITVTSPEGFNEMFTVRASNQQPFLDRVASLKKNLVANNYKPAVQRAAPSGTPASANAETEQAPLCAIHHEPMKKRNGNRGETFWSCAHKLEDGTWCPYRPKK